MKFHRKEKIWLGITILLFTLAVGIILKEDASKNETRIVNYHTTSEPFQYQTQLENNHHYSIEVRMSIGDCNGDTYLEGRLELILNQTLIFNLTKSEHVSKFFCGSDDPADDSEVSISFKFSVPQIDNPSNLNATGVFQESTNDFHSFTIEIFEDYTGSNFLSIFMGVLAFLSLFIYMIHVFYYAAIDINSP